MYAKIVLGLGLITSLYVAVMGLFYPATLANGFGVAIETASARNEIRGQYGGFFLAISVVFALALMDRIEQRLALAGLFVLAGGVLFGRISSLIIEGPSVFFSYERGIQVFFFVDIFFTVSTARLLFFVQPNNKQIRE